MNPTLPNREDSVPRGRAWVDPRAFGAQASPPPPLVGEIYTDEEGLTVTHYPARYAAGSLVQTITARPMR